MKKGLIIGIGIAAVVIVGGGVVLAVTKPWKSTDSPAAEDVKDSVSTDFVVSYDGIKTASIQAGGSVHDPSIVEIDGAYYIYGSHMTADESSDLLDPLSWKKERYPVLKTDYDLQVYGPGHNSFTVDEDGNDIMVYHARKEAEIEGNPLYNPNRHAMLMRIRWDENGRPIFSYKN